MVQPRESGRARSSMAKPSLLAPANRGRSVPRPSLRSIMACTLKFAVNQRASSIRGKKFRCRPRIEPPNIQVRTPNRTSHFCGDEKIIVRFSAAAQYAPLPFDPPCHTNHDHCRTNGLTGFAANDGNIKTRCGAIETAVELVYP